MKHIRKDPASEPETLRSYRVSTPEATYSGYTDSIPNPSNEAEREAKPLKQALCAEQREICCYCNRRISVRKCSVEHYLPQSRPEGYPVEYDEVEEGLKYGNMLVSCNDPFRNCSGLRGNSSLHVDPRKTFCEDIFRFQKDGKMIVAPGYTGKGYEKDLEETLHLNDQRLKGNRTVVIDKLRKDFEKGKYNTRASIEAQLKKLRDATPLPEYALVAEQYLRTKLSSRKA